MTTRILQPEGWPRPSGYANGLSARGRQIFVAGMVGWDANEQLAGHDLVSQARQALRNIVAVLACDGGRPEHVVRLTWYILDRDVFRTASVPLGDAYREVMGRHFPAMSVVEVSALVEPGALVARNVRHIYGAQLKIEAGSAVVPLPQDFQGQETAWRQILADHSFKQIDKSLRVLQTFVQGPGYVHVSPRTSGLALQLVARLLALCPCRQPDGNLFWPDMALSDPDRVVARLDTYISVYGARSTLSEAWASNPMWFELLVLLFDRSEFLAESAIRTPDLVEDLVESGQLRRRKTAAQILEELQHGRRDEDQRLWLRRYHQAEFMRLGLRDILGLVAFEQNLVELTALADACLQYALEIALRQHRLKRAPFAIVGLGKLGGAEADLSDSKGASPLFQQPASRASRARSGARS